MRENGDILAHHIEGVPWAEALAGLPFPVALLGEWAGKKIEVNEIYNTCIRDSQQPSMIQHGGGGQHRYEFSREVLRTT